MWKIANKITNLYCRSSKIDEDTFSRIINKGGNFTLRYGDDRQVIDSRTRRVIAKYTSEFGYCRIEYK